MKQKSLLALSLTLISVAVTPFLLNLRRVSAYEERVAEILAFETEHWYLPKKIPKKATRVSYTYTNGWKGSSNTLRFRLPERAAQRLQSQFSLKEHSHSNPNSFRPKIARSEQYEELVWTTSDGNHGSEGGVWYDLSKHDFIFYHHTW